MSTPNNPNMIIPRTDLSLCSILAYTENADGSWTAASSGVFGSGAVSLLGYIGGLALSIDPDLIQAVSVDAAYMNRVQGVLDASATLIEKVRRASSTSSGPYLSQIVGGYSAIKLTWAYNTVTAHNDIWTLYGRWSRFTGGIEGMGSQNYGITIALTDTSYTTVSGVTGIPPLSVTRS